jgi:hypothetical protein
MTWGNEAGWANSDVEEETGAMRRARTGQGWSLAGQNMENTRSNWFNEGSFLETEIEPRGEGETMWFAGSVQGMGQQIQGILSSESHP